jgi:hypothetical protein
MQEFKSGTSQVNRLRVKPDALLDMGVPDDVQISLDLISNIYREYEKG